MSPLRRSLPDAHSASPACPPGTTVTRASCRRALGRMFALAGASALLAACADRAPLAPTSVAALSQRVGAPAPAADQQALATLRRVTARYHDVDVAIADGFFLLHECESRPGEGPVGILYVHMDRLLDGVIDPALPDALLYEPSARGRPKLVGVELAVPYALWTAAQPPSFLGATFQREDEFGVYALHAWVWRQNPEGMFAEANPRVTCGAD